MPAHRDNIVCIQVHSAPGEPGKQRTAWILYVYLYDIHAVLRVSSVLLRLQREQIAHGRNKLLFYVLISSVSGNWRTEIMNVRCQAQTMKYDYRIFYR